MRRKINTILSVSLFVFVAAGCYGGKKTPDSFRPEGGVQTDQEIRALNSRLIASATASNSSPADYIIGPADLLEIRVFESDKLTSAVRVSSRGQITLPLLGLVAVEGLTARDAEEKIENLLKRGHYIFDPHVGVFVKEYKSKLVSVVGYVREPGSYELLGRRTILDILAAAKGLEEKAGRTVYLTREEENGGKQTYIVNLEQLLVKGNTDINLALRPGDVVYVPEAGAVFVEGAVRQPGSFTIKEGSTTLSKSIAMAGGLSNYADTARVKLIRYLDDGEREISELDLGRIQNGETEDLMLKDGDAIVVGASAARRVLYGLRLNFLLGLVGIGYDPPVQYQY